MSDIKRIIEHIEFEYEFATDDERLNSSLSVDERDELFITAAIEHLEEICRDFDTQHYNSIETGYLFNDAAADVSLKDYSIDDNGDSLSFKYDIVYDIHGTFGQDEAHEFAANQSEAYDNIHNLYELYCISSEVTRHFNIINESDVDEIEAIETSFSRSVKFEV